MKTKNLLSRRGFLKAVGVGAAAFSIGLPQMKSLVLGQPASGAANHAVSLRVTGGNFVFDPVALRINPGDTITWFQIVDFHSTTAFHPTNNNHQLRIPQGAEPWDSGILGLDGETFTFSHTFGEIEGVYDYFCIPHEFLGMVGRIIVGEALPGPATEQPLPDIAVGVIPDVDVITGLAGATYNGEASLNAPLLDLFEKRSGDAIVSVDSVIETFESGELENGSLWNALDSAGRLNEFRAQLGEFADLIRGNPAFGDALSKGDELKRTLELTRQDLSTS